MPIPMVAPLPPGIELGGGWKVRFTALDPTTGATAAGVDISAATIQVENLGGGALRNLLSGDWQLVPEKGP